MSGSVPLSRALLACLAGLSGAIAIEGLRDSVELASASILADRLRSGDDVEFRPIQRVAMDLGDKTSSACCRSDCLADALTVHLAYLDRLNEVDNYDTWSLSIERAIAFVEAAIQCSPADGNLWLRMAMLRQETVSIPSETASLMMRSVRMSPSEIDVLLARFEVWNKMSERGLMIAADGLKSDISNLLKFGNPRDIEYFQSKYSIIIEKLTDLMSK